MKFLKSYLSPILICCIALLFGYLNFNANAAPQVTGTNTFSSMLIGILCSTGIFCIPIIFATKTSLHVLPLEKPVIRPIIYAFLWVFIGTYALTEIIEPADSQALLVYFAKLIWWQKCTIALFIAGVIPVIEETLFRKILPDAFGPHIAAIAFAFAHGSITLFLPLLLFAYTLLALRERLHRLWPCMLVHGIFNLLSLIFI